MTMMTQAVLMRMLSRLLLPFGDEQVRQEKLLADPDLRLTAITKPEFDVLAGLANSNHVVIRALDVFAASMHAAGDPVRAGWAEAVLAAERERVRLALRKLNEICSAFQQENLDVTVMKSLDHWPDLGSDLDLFSNAPSEKVLDVMQRRFGARLAERSWGDRLAWKWNFLVPGLVELVEIHVGRLGQTGEQTVLASQLPGRARPVTLDGAVFPVPHASDRLMISTLQRMYRHFFFRLCDIVDSGGLVRSGAVDFTDLQRSAEASGIWPGVASYLTIVSDYLRQYGDAGLDLPSEVRAAARFGGACVYYAKSFLRVPILPQSAGLYGSQIYGLVRRGKIRSSARLSLLPWLATVALVEQKRTGSDKGIW